MAFPSIRIAWNMGRSWDEETKRKVSEAKKGTGVGKDNPFYGRKHNDETKRRMSDSHKGHTYNRGKVRTSEMIAAMAERARGNHNMLGHHHTEETKLRIAEKKRGLQHSEETRAKMSLSHWRGGLSVEPYCEAWADKEYKESIKERDGYTCQNPTCWKQDNCLTVHHVDYDKKKCTPDNLITLCRSCNTRANTNRNYWQEFYVRILTKEKCFVSNLS